MHNLISNTFATELKLWEHGIKVVFISNRDFVLIAESTYHGTINLGDTIAIGIQKKEAVTAIETLFYDGIQLIWYYRFMYRTASNCECCLFKVKVKLVASWYCDILPLYSDDKLFSRNIAL